MSSLPMINKPILGTGRFFVGYDELKRIVDAYLTPEECDAALRIFCALCYQRISYYSAPQESPFINENDDNHIAFILRKTPEEWKKIRKSVAKCFSVKGGIWRLREDAFYIQREGRASLSAALRKKILERDGYQCAYCSTTEGPFEIDHIHPVSRGGKDHPDNLTTACTSCNRSKSAMTLEEWGCK